MLLLLLACVAKEPAADTDAVTSTPTDSQPAGVDTDRADTEQADTAPVDTGPPPDSGDTAPPPAPPALEDCGLAAPVMTTRYAGPSPNVPSMPIAVVDAVAFDDALSGYCLGQFFPDGGQLIRCVDADPAAALYLQGAPAPGQDVWLALGVDTPEAGICWADEPHLVALGEPLPSPEGYAPGAVSLSTPDYPLTALSVVDAEGEVLLHAMALMDSPDFGIRAGDTLWSLDASGYRDAPLELQALDNGLFAFSSESKADSPDYAIIDPAYFETTAAVDRAGFAAYSYERCEPSEPGAFCIGNVHHGNASLPGTDVYLLAGYEPLYDGLGEPATYREAGVDYTLIGTVFKGYTFSDRSALEPAFTLSFMETFELSPRASETPGPAVYPGPDETHRAALYLNAHDVRIDDDDPDRFHLTGTLASTSVHGFYDLEIGRDGAVLDKHLYVPDNDQLTWLTPDGVSPVSPQPHNAELIGRDADGALHFLVYDRNAQSVRSETPYCAGFFHIVDRGGAVSVSGPYHTLTTTEGDGEICGNSMAYGDGSVVHGVTIDDAIDGEAAPLSLIVVSDNVAVDPDQAARGGTLDEIYYDGSPRITGIYTNPDRFDPEGWILAGTLVGHNGSDPDSNGFTNVLRDWPQITTADTPFVLDGL